MREAAREDARRGVSAWREADQAAGPAREGAAFSVLCGGGRLFWTGGACTRCAPSGAKWGGLGLGSSLQLSDLGQLAIEAARYARGGYR